PLLGVKYVRSSDVPRQHVRRELNARERGRYALGQGSHRQGLRQPRHAFDQHVSPRQEPEEEPMHEIVLPDEHLANLGPERLKLLLQQLGRFLSSLCRLHGGHSSYHAAFQTQGAEETDYNRPGVMRRARRLANHWTTLGISHDTQ